MTTWMTSELCYFSQGLFVVKLEAQATSEMSSGYRSGASENKNTEQNDCASAAINVWREV